MKMLLNVGTAEIFEPELEIDQDSDFGFTVVFDNGARIEMSHEAHEPVNGQVTISSYDEHDRLVHRKHVYISDPG